MAKIQLQLDGFASTWAESEAEYVALCCTKPSAPFDRQLAVCAGRVSGHVCVTLLAHAQHLLMFLVLQLQKGLGGNRGRDQGTNRPPDRAA